MKKILNQRFFERPTLVVASELLGKYLVARRERVNRAFMITEVEAYTGRGDMSSHAANGVTKRNKVMFGHPGRWYVYFIYGMYHCLNIVTEAHGTPAAVLIRGLDGISGPGKVCKALGITTRLYGQSAAKSSGLWIEDRGVNVGEHGSKIKRTPRVNVGGDEKAKKRRWRFILAS